MENSAVSFPLLIENIETKINELQTHFISQMQDFKEKQKILLELEGDFEKNLLIENEKFNKRMKEKREQIQKENVIEDLVQKQTLEFKRKPSVKAFNQGSSPGFFNKRQSSSRGLKRPIKTEEQTKKQTKLLVNLVKGEIENCEEASCQIQFTNEINSRNFKPEISQKQDNFLIWNKNYEIVEDFTKQFSLDFLLKSNDQMIGKGSLESDPSELKARDIWIEIKHDDENIGKILVQMEFI